MEETKAVSHHQQQILLQQQQFLFFQKLRQQQQQQNQLHEVHEQQQQIPKHSMPQQQQAISRFPSNIDAHLRPPGLLPRPAMGPQGPHPNINANAGSSTNTNLVQRYQHQQQQVAHQRPQIPHQDQQTQQQSKPVRPGSQVELQMAYQDAWHVCHPDFKSPFSSLEDACERLLPYHVVADYEAEEDDKILDSDTTGNALSRSQQWDQNIAAKIGEFTAMFEKQVLAFNIISRKRAQGEFRSEERLMIEQALAQEERAAMLAIRAEIESREKAGKMTTAIAKVEQARAGLHNHVNLMGQTSVSSGSQAMGPNVGQTGGPDMEHMQIGWRNSEKMEQPAEIFSNPGEAENEMGMQGEWHGFGEFDLNAR